MDAMTPLPRYDIKVEMEIKGAWFSYLAYLDLADDGWDIFTDTDFSTTLDGAIQILTNFFTGKEAELPNPIAPRWRDSEVRYAELRNITEGRQPLRVMVRAFYDDDSPWGYDHEATERLLAKVEKNYLLALNPPEIRLLPDELPKAIR